MSEVFKFETEVAGRKLIIETGKLANQANGSVTVTYGDTVILGTAVISNQTREGIDFFPLTVEFEERFYAAGRIKGSRFMKRDGRPTDDAVLSGRLIDRAIRPLFSDEIRNEVQVILTVLSFDGENESKMVGLIAASAALAISDIPWAGPIGGITVGMKDDQFIVNPTVEEIKDGQLELSLAGTSEKIVMIESEAKQIPEDKVAEAFKFGMDNIKPIVDLIQEAAKKVGKNKLDIEDLVPKETLEFQQAKKDTLAKIDEFIAENVNPYLLDGPKPTKALRKHGLYKLVDQLEKKLVAEGLDDDLANYVKEKAVLMTEAQVSAAIMESEVRVDGRKLNEIRPLVFETGLLKRIHGTGLFQRGETQVMTFITLGSPGDVQTLDTMEKTGEKSYMHFYNFPPYSVGEVKRVGMSRRDIGHGALAEKALRPVMPEKAAFPYTVLAVSETMGSNGSSSMASTCGSTLALLDAGVPLKSPVAGIAMGLAVDGKGGYKILTDIQDLEDGPGGMDFKITGTKTGLTAIQMDTKTDGITFEMISKTLTQGREALNQILDGINKAIPQPNEMSAYAPKITTFNIAPDTIKDVIGPGGKIINKIIDETGVNIDIDDDGLVMVTTADAEMMQKAVDWIKNIVKVPEAGETYTGKVVKIMDFGAFVEILPGKDGLIHISKLSTGRVDRVEDVLDEGMEVKVRVQEVDAQGKISLVLLEGGKTPPTSSSTSRPAGSSDRDRFRRGSRDDRKFDQKRERRGKPFFKKRDR